MYDKNTCVTTLKLKSSAGCPKYSATAWVEFLNENPWVIAVLMIIFGLITTFFGKKFFTITLSVACGGFVFMASMFLFSLMGMLEYLDDKNQGNVGLVILAFFLAIALGGLVGWVTFKV